MQEVKGLFVAHSDQKSRGALSAFLAFVIHWNLLLSIFGSAAPLSSLFLPRFLVYGAIYNFSPSGFFVTPFAVFVFLFSQYPAQRRLVPEALVIPWALSVGDCFFCSLMKCSQMLPQLNFVAYLLSWTARCCLAISSERSNYALPKGDTLNCFPHLRNFLGGDAHLPQHVCGGRRTVCGSWFSPSTMRLPGIRQAPGWQPVPLLLCYLSGPD